MCGIAGIFGYKSNKAQKAFDPVILKFLLLEQDSRGRDNCGIYYKAKDEEGNRVNAIAWGYEKDDAGPTKTMHQFLAKRDLLPFSGPYCVIGHSRKGSVGGGSRDNAHPFKCGNIVGVHNGTIKAWKDLMEFLDVDVTDIETDSEALFKAISEGKTEDLLKYHPGAATLVWTDIETGLCYVWCSGSYSTVTKTKTADREFHIWRTSAGLYFSSEYNPLRTASLMKKGEDFEVKYPQQVPVNTLLVFDQGKLIEQKEIERTPYYKSSTAHNSGNDTTKTGKIKHVSPSTRKTTTTHGSNGSSTVKPIGDSVKREVSTLFNLGKDYTDYSQKKLPGLEEEPKDTPYFQLAVRNGLYFRGSICLHSNVNYSTPLLTHHMEEFRTLGYWIDTRYFVTESGVFYWKNDVTEQYTCCDPNVKINPKMTERQAEVFLTEVFFFNGIMIRSEAALIEMLEVLHNMKKEATRMNFRLNSTTVAKFAIHPVWEALSFPNLDIVTYINFGLTSIDKAADKGYKYFKGWYRFPYTNTIYRFSDEGVPVEYKKYKETMTSLENPDKFEDFKKTVASTKAKWCYKANGVKNEVYSTSCPDCGDLHRFTKDDIQKVPSCFNCGYPIVVEDEKYFPKAETKSDLVKS
jgi:hypothetical protein